jgi:hypothetical protein
MIGVVSRRRQRGEVPVNVRTLVQSGHWLLVKIATAGRGTAKQCQSLDQTIMWMVLSQLSHSSGRNQGGQVLGYKQGG